MKKTTEYSSIPQICPKCNKELLEGNIIIEDANGTIDRYLVCFGCEVTIVVHYDYCYWEEE